MTITDTTPNTPSRSKTFFHSKMKFPNWKLTPIFPHLFLLSLFQSIANLQKPLQKWKWNEKKQKTYFHPLNIPRNLKLTDNYGYYHRNTLHSIQIEDFKLKANSDIPSSPAPSPRETTPRNKNKTLRKRGEKILPSPRALPLLPSAPLVDRRRVSGVLRRGALACSRGSNPEGKAKCHLAAFCRPLTRDAISFLPLRVCVCACVCVQAEVSSSLAPCLFHGPTSGLRLSSA